MCECMCVFVLVCVCACVCVSVCQKIIKLLLFAGDIKVKDTKINEVQLQLKQTESKCLWTLTNTMWSHMNTKKD